MNSTATGRVFFVHNRVHNIQSVADDVKQLVPDARIIIGHGQMPSRELERVMLAFMRREADILVSTTIIESGIDNPMANTMFINRADHFGLADLHQLRGRVGRYKHRAYCYLLLPEDRPLTEVAARRLKAIEQYSMLGAGFKIAMRDLEIRGAGNLLGGRAVRAHRGGGLRDVLHAAGSCRQEATPRARHRAGQDAPGTADRRRPAQALHPQRQAPDGGVSSDQPSLHTGRVQRRQSRASKRPTATHRNRPRR